MHALPSGISPLAPAIDRPARWSRRLLPARRGRRLLNTCISMGLAANRHCVGNVGHCTRTAEVGRNRSERKNWSSCGLPWSDTCKRLCQVQAYRLVQQLSLASGVQGPFPMLSQRGRRRRLLPVVLAVHHVITGLLVSRNVGSCGKIRHSGIAMPVSGSFSFRERQTSRRLRRDVARRWPRSPCFPVAPAGRNPIDRINRTMKPCAEKRLVDPETRVGR